MSRSDMDPILKRLQETNTTLVRFDLDILEAGNSEGEEAMRELIIKISQETGVSLEVAQQFIATRAAVNLDRVVTEMQSD